MVQRAQLKATDSLFLCFMLLPSNWHLLLGSFAFWAWFGGMVFFFFSLMGTRNLFWKYGGSVMGTRNILWKHGSSTIGVRNLFWKHGGSEQGISLKIFLDPACFLFLQCVLIWLLCYCCGWFVYKLKFKPVALKWYMPT